MGLFRMAFVDSRKESLEFCHTTSWCVRNDYLVIHIIPLDSGSVLWSQPPGHWDYRDASFILGPA